MKNTGIIRRIDDLGRIVIPKEIRRTLRVREGDAMEIWLDENNGVVFRKYDKVGCFKNELEAAVAGLRAVYPEFNFFVCDRDGDVLTPKSIDTLEVSDTILRAIKMRSRQRDLYRDGLPVEAQPIIVYGEVFAVLVAVCRETTDVSPFDEAVKAMSVQTHMLSRIAEC